MHTRFHFASAAVGFLPFALSALVACGQGHPSSDGGFGNDGGGRDGGGRDGGGRDGGGRDGGGRDGGGRDGGGRDGGGRDGGGRDGGVLPPPDLEFDETLYIDGSLSTACSGTYDVASRACGGGTQTAYQTFAAASEGAAPGTLFLIREGTYREVLHLAVSGSATAYVGYSAYDDETVVIADVNSSESGEDYGPIWLDHVSYNLIRGLTVRGSVGFLRAVDAHHNVIDACNFDGSTLYPSASKRGGLYFAGSHHNQLINSRVFQGTDSLSLVHSDYNLIAGNTFELAGHDIFSIKCGSYNVLRTNDFTNPNQKLGSVFDCEGDTMSWHGNGDLVASMAILDATRRNVIEGNVFHGSQAYYSTSGGNGIQYAGQDGIVRRNVFYATNVGLAMQHYPDEALYVHGTRVYHNVFHANYCAGIALRGPDGEGRIADNEYLNNILWDNQGWDGDCSGVSPAQILYRSSMIGHRWRRNDIASSLGNTIIRAEFGSEYMLSAFGEASVFESTLEVDPAFTNADDHDYTLSVGSPLDDAGDFLTTIVSASGSGSIIQVDDAGYFYDGFGIEGERGDVVQLEGQTETATIMAVDYATNTVTVDRPLTWTSGLGLGLRFDGVAPNIGAFE